MKKLLVAASMAVALLGTPMAAFAEQENDNMNLKEMRRQMYFMMMEQDEAQMSMLKDQQQAIAKHHAHLKDLYDKAK